MPTKESPAWNVLHAGFAMKRINHQDGFLVSTQRLHERGRDPASPACGAANSDTITISPDPMLVLLRPGGGLA